MFCPIVPLDLKPLLKMFDPLSESPDNKVLLTTFVNGLACPLTLLGQELFQLLDGLITFHILKLLELFFQKPHALGKGVDLSNNDARGRCFVGLLCPRLLSKELAPDFLILENLAYDLGINLLKLIGKSIDQGPVTQDVDEPWDPPGSLIDPFMGLGGEEIASVDSSCHPHAVNNVIARLVWSQGLEDEVHGDSLDKLPHIFPFDLYLERRLPRENKLEEVVLSLVQVGEHTDLLQGLAGEVMGLVYDQETVISQGILLGNKMIKAPITPNFACAIFVQFEFPEDHPDELQGADPGVEDHGHLDPFIQIPDQVFEEGGFARTHITSDDYESCLVSEAVVEVVQGCLVLGAQEEIIRIRQKAEGLFPKTVEIEVHGLVPKVIKD